MAWPDFSDPRVARAEAAMRRRRELPSDHGEDLPRVATRAEMLGDPVLRDPAAVAA